MEARRVAHWDGNSRAAAGRRVLAKRLMDYATSPVCKTPLDEAISHTERARKNLLREMKQHVSDRRVTGRTGMSYIKPFVTTSPTFRRILVVCWVATNR